MHSQEALNEYISFQQPETQIGVCNAWWSLFAHRGSGEVLVISKQHKYFNHEDLDRVCAGR